MLRILKPRVPYAKTRSSTRQPHALSAPPTIKITYGHVVSQMLDNTWSGRSMAIESYRT